VDFDSNNNLILSPDSLQISDSFDAIKTVLFICGAKRSTLDEAAEAFFGRFGSLKNMLKADKEELTDLGFLTEIQATKIKIMCAFMMQMMIDRYPMPVKTDGETFSDYLKAVFFFERREKLMIFPVNSSGSAVASHIINEGAQNSVHVIFDNIRKYMFEGGKRGRFIIAHNHPDTVCTPSADDISATDFIKNKAAECGGELLGHYIVGVDGVFKIPENSNYLEFLFNQNEWE
jgi:DNA repair protein RadC